MEGWRFYVEKLVQNDSLLSRLAECSLRKRPLHLDTHEPLRLGLCVVGKDLEKVRACFLNVCTAREFGGEISEIAA